MGATSGRVVVITLTAALLTGGLAWAEEPPEPVRLPVALSGREDAVTRVTVVEGDHLWRISERHVRGQLGREPTTTEVSPYWRKVVSHNMGNLRSGDPDLIYPGEVIDLPSPAISGQP